MNVDQVVKRLIGEFQAGYWLVLGGKLQVCLFGECVRKGGLQAFLAQHGEGLGVQARVHALDVMEAKGSVGVFRDEIWTGLWVKVIVAVRL